MNVRNVCLATALAILVIPPAVNAQSSADPVALTKLWNQENENCRGGQKDDPKTDVACSARQNLDGKLRAIGWCFEYRGASSRPWHPCDPMRINDYLGRQVDTEKQVYLWPTIYCPASLAALTSDIGAQDLFNALRGDLSHDGRLAVDLGCREGGRMPIYDIQLIDGSYVAFNTERDAKWKATQNAVGVPMWVTFTNRITNKPPL